MVAMPLLETSSLTVRFGGHVAVNSVDLQAEPGAITGLIGPNGAGKTTMFNAVTGLQEVGGGRVRLDGRDVTGAGPHERARLGIARTFQRLEVFGSLTVRENVLVGAEARRRWAHDPAAKPPAETDALLERVGLSEVGSERAESLPTGTARLVELARALATRPKLLLLDEPASGQDERETERFAELLKELCREGMGILLVEHDVPLVMALCSHIVVLDFGRVLAAGPPSEIQANQEVLDAYLGGAPVSEELAVDLSEEEHLVTDAAS